METKKEESVSWDVTLALRDLSLEMLEFHSNKIPAPPETVRRWHDWVHRAQRAHNALAWACEDLVELGATPERLEAMKVALTHAMGQKEYWARADRW